MTTMMVLWAICSGATLRQLLGAESYCVKTAKATMATRWFGGGLLVLWIASERRELAVRIQSAHYDQVSPILSLLFPFLCLKF